MDLLNRTTIQEAAADLADEIKTRSATGAAAKLTHDPIHAEVTAARHHRRGDAAQLSGGAADERAGFLVGVQQPLAKRERYHVPSLLAKGSAVISVFLWFMVLALGRGIGFL